MTLELIQVSMVLVFALFLLLGSGVWIGLIIFSVVPVEKSLATALWQTTASWTLAALPLFIWMGEILFRAKLSKILFRGITPWIARLPGRLMHVNVMDATFL